MRFAVVYDTEFLVTQDARQRFWYGPYDPDPIVVQIGAVRLGIEGDFSIMDTLRVHIRPVDRHGSAVPVDPFFEKLTGITSGTLDDEGVPLATALDRLVEFSGTAKLWSWGKDELNLMAISCFVAGIAPPIPAARFGNACALVLAAGMPYDDVKVTRSSGLADYFGVPHPPLAGHDGLDDALSVAYALQHLLRAGALSPDALDPR